MELVPEISIVVPCYNHGHFLGDAVDGAFRSTRSVEVVVVNNGSDEVVESIEAPPGVEVRRVAQTLAGVAAGRNRGLEESRGRYVVFLDAEDRLTPGGLDAGADALDDHPESAFVFGRARMITADGSQGTPRSEPRIATNHYRELLRRNCIGVTATVMFRREALERAGGFNPAVTATADYELYLHIARHHPVHDHAQVVVEHRSHEAALDVDASRMLREILLVLREQRPFLEADDASLDAYEEGWRRWQAFYGGQLADEMRAAMSAGHWMRAAGRAVALARYDPRGVARHAAQTFRVGRRLSPAK